MSFRKREIEYEAAERKYRTGLLRIIRQAFLIRPPATKAGLRKINITKELKRRIIKQKLYSITEELFNIGTKHGTELIEELQPKTTSAAISIQYPQSAAAEPYNQRLINELTDHTITSMSFIADDAKKELITSLEEGYAQGEGIPALTKRVQQTWDGNRIKAVRFARTFTNEVYNQAHFNRYQESTVVDGIQFSAHLDSRTSEQCRMLNMTIWAKGDPDIQLAPLHFNCRSRTIPYFGKIPGKRDFRHTVDGTEFTNKDISKIQNQIKVFKTKYWNIPISEIPKFPG